jgi:hypothetical protein
MTCFLKSKNVNHIEKLQNSPGAYYYLRVKFKVGGHNNF